MPDEFLTCPDCAQPYETEDNYCRRCGMYVAAVREQTALAARPVQPLERYQRERAPLPAPVKKAATAVAVGAAMQVGLSLASRYLAGQAAQKAARAAVSGPTGRRGRALSSPSHSGLPDDIAAVSETVIVRRMWIRRP
ncbi:MAG: hypothetical protein AB7T37_12360 [Dehalococcoidia bacterium]